MSHDGLIHVDRARIWTLPEVQPALVCPAVSVATARKGAEWADGLVTVHQPHDKLREMIAAYRDAGGRGKLAIQVHLSWDPNPDRATEIAARLAGTPHPEGTVLRNEWYVDIRPIVDSFDDHLDA